MASIDDVFEKVVSLDRISEDRYEHLKSGLNELKRAEGAEGEKMSTVNVENPMGGMLPLLMGGNWGGGSTAGAVGGGLGAGVLGDIQAVRQTQSNVNFGVQGNAAQTASAANNRVN